MATKKTEKATVATPSLAWNAMQDEWTKVQTLLEGTQAMRDAGEAYLPMHDEETKGNYDDRLASNVLFNMTALVLNSWVGKPFSRTISYSDNFDHEIVTEDMLEDIDLDGNALYVFARNWFKAGIAFSMSHVLIDMPRVDRVGRTAADDIAQKVRPYFVHVLPQNLIFAHTFREQGRELYDEIRIREVVTEMDDTGWAEVQIEQIRRLTRVAVYHNLDTITGQPIDPEVTSAGFEGYQVKVELWRQSDAAKKKDEWYVYDQWMMEIAEIPLVTFYSDRTGLMTGKSPILDLADLNIRHWQSTADQINVLVVARFPMLGASGVSSDGEDGSKTTVGPKEVLFSPDPNGKFYYVEHSGAAIASGRIDLQDLEVKMAAYGANFMKKRTSRESATAANIDSAEATSPLQDVTSRFNDALNWALYYISLWQGKKAMTGKATVSTEFASSDPAELSTLDNARTRGDLAQDLYLKELLRRGVLADDFDMDANAKALRAEAAEVAAIAAKEAQLKADATAKAAAALQPKQEDQEDQEDQDMPQAMKDQQDKMKNNPQ